jgi:hypothetical protein
MGKKARRQLIKCASMQMSLQLRNWTSKRLGEQAHMQAIRSLIHGQPIKENRIYLPLVPQPEVLLATLKSFAVLQYHIFCQENMTNEGPRGPSSSYDHSFLDEIVPSQGFDSHSQPWLDVSLYSSLPDFEAEWPVAEISTGNQSSIDSPRDASNRRKRKASMGDVQPKEQRFPCPIFENETRQGLEHTCNGRGGNSMSELRRHMIRTSKSRQAHLRFLKRCETCQDDIIDEQAFLEQHGAKCNESRPVKKGKAADEHYRAFCGKVVPSSSDTINLSRKLAFEKHHSIAHKARS